MSRTRTSASRLLQLVETRTPIADARSLNNGAPFLELSFVQYKRLVTAEKVWIISYPLGDSSMVHAVGVFGRGRFSSHLGIMLLSPLPEHSSKFWDAILDFAADNRASSIGIEFIGSDIERLPNLQGVGHRANAFSYVVDLERADPMVTYSSNHKRNIRKAIKSGMAIVRPSEDIALGTHMRLCNESYTRHERAHKAVGPPIRQADLTRYFTSRTAQLYHATLNGAVVSSMLIVTIQDAAFYDTGGTDGQGFKVGASHFLMHSIIEELKEKSVKFLNLGVSTQARKGLTQFKSGFGAESYFREGIRIDRRRSLLQFIRQRLLA